MCHDNLDTLLLLLQVSSNTVSCLCNAAYSNTQDPRYIKPFKLSPMAADEHTCTEVHEIF